MRRGDTATFDTAKYTASVTEMKARKEEVHDKGREVYKRTGRLDPLVDIKGKQRVSHNSMAKDGGKIILKNGIALSIFTGFDGTGSMAENSVRAHEAQGRINSMLSALNPRYNIQLSISVIQDVCDEHEPFQMSQFESDERTAEQLRLLVPDGGGGDSTEDYQFALAYLMMATHTDIYDFYGLKGYGFIVGDEIGRENVTVEGVKEYLGLTLQNTMSTREVARALLPKWHMFYVHVGSSGAGGHKDHATDWWEDKFGPGHVVLCQDPKLIAEVQCALIYVTETAIPTEDGLFAFLNAGGANKKITEAIAKEIWNWIINAKVEFGAQTKLAGYADIPLPGAVFEHYRHQWPISHPRFAENIIPTETAADAPFIASKTGKFDWKKF
jgi:hypothetical protein